MPDVTKETDARILIDDLLRQAGWDPSDKSMVLTEVTAALPGGASAGAEVDGLSGASLTGGGTEAKGGRAQAHCGQDRG